MCSCQRTRRLSITEPFKPDNIASANCFVIKRPSFVTGPASRSALRRGSFLFSLRKLVGVTGFEPVTLRLSSACSNQLSYTPIKPNLACRAGARAKAGGAEGIRTPDLQLAKLPLYQLSYSPTFYLRSTTLDLQPFWRKLSFANLAVISEFVPFSLDESKSNAL